MLIIRWDTILHAENKQAKFLITANKMRISVLRKKLDDIEKQRTFNAQKRKETKERLAESKTRGNSANSTANDVKESAPKKMFILDRLKHDPSMPREEAGRQVSSAIQLYSRVIFSR